MKTKKQNLYTADFDALVEKRFGKETLTEWKKEAHHKADILLATHELKKNKKQNLQTGDFQELAEKLVGKEKAAELKKEAHREAEILRAMHKLITSSVEEYMQDQQVGFNELARRLKLSPTYVSRMRKGQANLTFGTFAQVMGILGKEASEFLKIKK